MALDPVTAGLEFGGRLIDRLWPDPADANRARAELYRLDAEGELARMLEASKLSLAEIERESVIAAAQARINEVEAASDDPFLGRWRPFFGWVCGFAFGWHFVLGPMLAFALNAFGNPIALPELPMEALMTVLFGLLGLGGYRTYERTIGKIPPGR
jgi:hypothetical protein